jgi:hypothetical protein
VTGGDSGSKLVMKGSSVRVRASAFCSFPGSFVGQGNDRAALTTLLSGSRVRDGYVRDPFSVGEVVRSRWCGSVDLQGVLHLRDSLEGQVCLPANGRQSRSFSGGMPFVTQALSSASSRLADGHSEVVGGRVRPGDGR